MLLRTDPLLPKLYLGIVLNKASTQLQKALLAAHKAMVANGTYAKVLESGIFGACAERPGINLESNPPRSRAEAVSA